MIITNVTALPLGGQRLKTIEFYGVSSNNSLMPVTDSLHTVGVLLSKLHLQTSRFL